MGESQESGKSASRLSVEGIAAWFAVVATVGAPLYILGLVVLALQIGGAYRMDFGSAWYAASLASNTVVLGIGIDFVRANAVSLCLYLVGAVVIVSDARRRYTTEPSPDDPPLKRWSLARARLRVRGVGWHRALLGVVVATVALGLLAGAMRGTLREMVAAVLPIVIGFVVSLLVSVEVVRRQHFLKITVEVLALFYVSIALSALVGGRISPPPLPPIEITEDGGNVVRGKLINHADGYWHILIELDGTLVSIADDSTKAVAVQPRGPRATPIARP